MYEADFQLIEKFLPRGEFVLLPDKKNPKLFIPSNNPLDRWQKSKLYPAFRTPAKIYKLLLRLKASVGLNGKFENKNEVWGFGLFLKNVLPTAKAISICKGTPGPTQKLTLQIWDDDKVIAYAKYAERKAACRRLEQEYQVLKSLKRGIAPQPILFDTYGGGSVLIIEPVSGKLLSPKLPPEKEILKWLGNLYMNKTYSIYQHPWIESNLSILDQKTELWMKSLENRKWDVVISHGDFVPWNILQTEAGNLVAIDWEYGIKEGFPFLDLCHYLLQTAALIYRWSPIKAKDYSIRFLTQKSWSGLNEAEAISILNITVFHSHHQFLIDGHPDNSPSQLWRREIWEESR